MSEVLSSPDGSRVLELPDIEPLRPDFLHVDVSEIFDWPDIFQQVSDYYGWNPAEERNLYLVVFRSMRKPGADADLLTELDDKAYLEAQTSAALLLYYKGELGEDGECVSFCIWTSGEEAWRATRGPDHQRAAEAAKDMYDPYFVDHIRVGLRNGQVTFEASHR